MSTQNKTIEEQLAAAQVELTDIKAQLETAGGEKTALAGKLAAEEQAHNVTKAQLTTVSGERDTFKAKVGELEAAAKSADQRAQEIIAGLGQPKPAPSTPGIPTAQKTKREEYAALTDPTEKARFWAKHETEIREGK